jgi:hypothetical protein
MVNPLLTILFDLFIVGSALLIVAALVAEQFAMREPSVGRVRRSRPMVVASTRAVHGTRPRRTSRVRAA